MHEKAATIRPFAVTHRSLLAIALPAALALITEPVVGMVDTILIGRLGDAALLGGVALGAVAFDVLFALFFFLRLGTAGLVAQAVGAADRAGAAVHLMRALIISLILGGLFLALAWPVTEIMVRIFGPEPAVEAAFRDYFGIRLWSLPLVLLNFTLAGWLYGRGDARTALLLALVINGVNAAASLYLVLGAGLGVPGVAWGTVLAQLVATLGGLWLVLRHYEGVARFLALVPADALRQVEPLKRLFSLSASLIIRSVALMAAFAYFSAQGSRAGATVLAANAILLNFFALSTFFLDGLATATEQLCGKAVGAGYRPAFRRATRLGLGWGLVIASGLSLLLFAAGSTLIDWMTTAEDVRIAAKGMLIFAALTPLSGMPAFIADGVVTGATMAREMRNGMVVASALFFAFALLLEPLWGMSGLWVALHLLFVFRALILFAMVRVREPSLFPDPGRA
ncbi:putative efflux protein, MATE family [Devosia enhydra]|uniref:Putative efflux protein, MATE family n=1 Tax=Devosia enhydra TaxID=665118 RepID=A0A1K2I1Y5_9HYPH|nr:MATE family efflux transporter [Devosia enhydra]SFZ86263.1 putative efflux protein, MATE family [Devosia enhydra]